MTKNVGRHGGLLNKTYCISSDPSYRFSVSLSNDRSMIHNDLALEEVPSSFLVDDVDTDITNPPTQHCSGKRQSLTVRA